MVQAPRSTAHATGIASVYPGVLFYALDTRLRHGHGIWHLFVLAGSLSHYFAIFFYVA